MSYKSVFDIPENQLFQFDKYYYVWKIKMHSTRGGRHSFDKALDIAEVYEIYNDMVTCVASGRLVENKNSSFNNEFSIFDYDQDTNYTFHIANRLKEADKSELLLVRDSVLEYKKKSNSYNM